MESHHPQYDPLSTPLVMRHRMSMPSSSNGHHHHQPEFVPNNHQRYENNNNGGVVTLLPNGHANTVRWSCQSYESGITESSFNSYGNGSGGGEASRVNVQEMLDRGFEETEVLRRWLDSFGLMCYYDSFLLAGYDSLSIMSRMTAEDLTAIGITEPNHRRRLRHELGKLHFADNYAEIVNENLFEFLTQLGLEHYTGALSRTGCDTTAKLLQLELEDLEDVGVAKLGHQKRLYLAIKHYTSKSRRTSTISNKTMQLSSADSNAARPPINHHHRNSAPVLRHHQPSALIVGKTRPTSITKQLTTFQEAPRSPNVIVTNTSSAAAIAANFVQNGGLVVENAKRNTESPYGFTGGTDSAAAFALQQQDFGIYSTGSLNGSNVQQNNNRHSFNYSPLRFPLKNASSATHQSSNAESPTSRSVHSGPQQFSYHNSLSQPSPTHSLNRLSLTTQHAVPSSPSFQQQQQRAHSIYSSTPPPPSSSQQHSTQQFNDNYAAATGGTMLTNGHHHYGTLPRTNGGRHSALSFCGSSHSGNNNKKSPTTQNNGRICDTIGEPLTGEDAHDNNPHNSMPYCRAASFENHLHQQQPLQLNSVHQRRMSGHRAQSNGAAPPPPPPRALQTTLDFSSNATAAAEFPPPPSPLAVAPLPMMLSLQHNNDFVSNNLAGTSSSGRNAALPPATLIMPRKQPQTSMIGNADFSRDFSTRSSTQPQVAYTAPRAATLHELLTLNSRNTAAGSSANKNFNISPDLPPNGVNVIGGSISTTDSGNSSASSVDEEHDARARGPTAAAGTIASTSSATNEREPEDVLNEISGMLANLTDELDNMLQY